MGFGVLHLGAADGHILTGSALRGIRTTRALNRRMPAAASAGRMP